MFSLKRIAPKLWHLHFDTQYDMAMHCLRFTECHDTAADKFFTIAEFKKKYKKKRKAKTFTYAEDWGGFTLYKSHFKPFMENPLRAFPDKNVRDELMIGIIKTIMAVGTRTFCLISTSGDQPEYKHEIAHALWYLDKNYKKEMQKNIAEISKPKLAKFYKNLTKKYYDHNEDDLVDELQAYAATGLLKEMEKNFPRKIKQKFVATFKRYYKYVPKP